ncbi:MAG: right-handed parallel beta-helix repeat-containing protein [Deltaproteobacteria bacterium]|nr:right-handed parallel beta-helix repeat-containing protein [Deltaproteobacteria bacterium]
MPKSLKMYFSLSFFSLGILAGLTVDAQARVIQVPAQYVSIQAAVNAASRGDTIEVAGGVYLESIVFMGNDNSGITIKGVGTPPPTITSGGRGRVISIYEADNVRITGVHITGGATAGQDIANFGGGIFVDGSNGFEISNSVIDNNKAVYGGGLAFRGGSVSVINNTVQNNAVISATNAYGGGIYLYGATGLISGNTIQNNTTAGPNAGPGAGVCMVSSSTAVSNNTFRGNKTAGLQHYGGGLYTYQCYGFSITNNTFTENQGLDGGGMAIIASNPTIFNNLFTHNQGRWGGGLYGWQMASTIDSNTFSQNNASDGGGGILFDGSSAAVFTNNTVTGNNAVNWGGGVDLFISSCLIAQNIITLNTSARGGGVCVTPSSNARIINNLITNNMTTIYGGGLVVGDGSSGLVANNLIANNVATNDAGGICIYSGQNGVSSPMVVNNTIVNNQIGNTSDKSAGGGIRVDNSTPVIMNNIIAGHSTGAGIGANNAGAKSSNSYNNMWGNQATYVYVTAGVGATESSPGFISTNGKDYHLLNSSSCLKKGNPDAAYNNLDGTRNQQGMYGGPNADWRPYVFMETDKESYARGAKMRVTISEGSMSNASSLALGIALLQPNGALVFYPNMSSDFKPFQNNLTLPKGTQLVNSTMPGYDSYLIPSNYPTGSYTWLCAFLDTATGKITSRIATTSFMVTP